MPTKKPDWEERFEKKFPSRRLSFYKGFYFLPNPDKEDVIAFIKQVEKEAEERVKDDAYWEGYENAIALVNLRISERLIKNQ